MRLDGESEFGVKGLEKLCGVVTFDFNDRRVKAIVADAGRGGLRRSAKGITKGAAQAKVAE